jgi:hypothetical protein
MREGDILAGQYRLCERVGRGAYGTVWRAEELRGGRAVVAIKVFHDQPDDAEMAMLAQLDHPHILRYRATIEHEGQLCLLTDYADGGDVGRLLEAYPQGLPVDQALELLRGLASALHYLHELRVVHRDVKPANMLLVNGRVRLADVGLAKALERTSTRGTSTASPLYAAPELYQGVVSTRVDVYALGATAFELLTGRPPFVGNPFELMVAHLHQAPPELPPHVPEFLRALVGACLEKRPEDRPEVEALLPVLAIPSPPPLPPPQPTPTPTPPPPPPKPPLPPPPRPWLLRRLAAAIWSRLPWPGHPFRRGVLLGGLVGVAVFCCALSTLTPAGRAVVWGLGDVLIDAQHASGTATRGGAWLASEWFRLVGMHAYNRGRLQEAHENFKLAIALAPWRAEPAYNMAVTCFDLDAKPKACESLQRAIANLQPDEQRLRDMAERSLDAWGCR